MSEKTGTFLVTAVDQESAVLRDVHDAQVHTLDGSPEVSEQEIVEATIEPVPPMDVVWQMVDIDETRTIEVTDSDLEPTTQAREAATEQNVGEITTIERAGEGEVHVLTVPDGEMAATAAEVLEDDETLARAARLDVDRVEVRTAAQLVAVRYLPD